MKSFIKKLKSLGEDKILNWIRLVLHDKNFIDEEDRFNDPDLCEALIINEIDIKDLDSFKLINYNKDNLRNHYRFDMSGYDNEIDGNIINATVAVQRILSKFIWLGIYDYTEYLALDFYKGGVYLYYSYDGRKHIIDEECDGYTTSEIIYHILCLTVFTNRRSKS
jgi:hypothetical protein